MNETINTFEQRDADPGIGLDMGHLAQVLEDRKGYFSTSAPVPWENLKTVDLARNESTVSGNYDDTTKVVVRSKGKKELSVTKDNITNQDMILLFGAVEQDGQMFENDGDGQSAPYVAFGYRRATVNGYRLVWVYKCRASLGNETSNTKEETVSLQDATLTLAAANRNADGEWRTWMDIDAADYTDEVAEMWFSQETLSKLKGSTGKIEFDVLCATLHDTSGKVKDAELVKNGTYQVELSGSTIQIQAENLKKHTNGQGTEGYWIGAKLVLPDRIAQKADTLRFYFGDSERRSGVWSGTIASVIDTDSAEKNEISFYADKGAARPKVYIAIELPSRLVKSFTMDLSGVTLDAETPSARSK